VPLWGDDTGVILSSGHLLGLQTSKLNYFMRVKTFCMKQAGNSAFKIKEFPEEFM
jgi:hypothetical protein